MVEIINKNRIEPVELKPLEIEGMGRVEDSRTKITKVTHPTMPMERTYCTNCGAPYGWVTQESSEYIAVGEVVVFCNKCDADMSTKLGPIPLECIGDEHTIDFTKLRNRGE